MNPDLKRCRNCGYFRVNDPDAHTLITKGKCLNSKSDLRFPAAVDNCWLFQRQTRLDKMKKALHRTGGRIRAWNRRMRFQTWQRKRGHNA